eukprot:gnl/TRDRNA2_/TRDRNA2_173361_c0_seq4.p1 gnl/TRDRNA2_/TRDRNA2_173361_c0~~gnl/TRDRNA2_/TRDRNA2_173361_c0_seq4.p1  ORF type:complete len:295 (-),score=45.51 gnl/TRDRNA2_/TRDRNA2_173361_c0_seq4:204-1031(-)
MASKRKREDADDLREDDLVQVTNYDHVVVSSSAASFGKLAGFEHTTGIEFPDTKFQGMIGVVQGHLKVDVRTWIIVAPEGESTKSRNSRTVFFADRKGLVKLKRTLNNDSVPAAVMRQLWASRSTTGDVALTGLSVEGDTRESRVHSCILSIVSPALAAGFRSGMQEAASKQMQINGTSIETVEGILELAYTGKKSTTFDIIEGFEFAHQYMIMDAAALVSKEVIHSITKENAARIVRLLRGFDGMEGSSTEFVDAMFEEWGSNKTIMKAIVTHL